MVDDERNQARHILLNALDRFYSLIMSEDEAGRRGLEEVEAWFAASDETDPRAFVSICRRLELDPEGIRATLARRRAETRGDRNVDQQ